MKVNKKQPKQYMTNIFTHKEEIQFYRNAWENKSLIYFEDLQKYFKIHEYIETPNSTTVKSIIVALDEVTSFELWKYKARFKYYAVKEKIGEYLHYHTQDLKGRSKRLFHFRGWISLEKLHKSLNFEFVSNSSISFYFRVDPHEREVGIHLSLPFQMYFTLENFLPKKWYPKTEKELAFSIHSGSVWISIWHNPNSWSKSDPKWQHTVLHYKDWFIGKVKYNYQVTNVEQIVLPYYEGNYNVEVTEELRVPVYSRWYMRWLSHFQEQQFFYDVKAGYYIEDIEPDGAVKFKWVDKPVPVEGKGENSYDCDEDATWSMSVGGCRSCRDAAFKFWTSTMNDRIRYGGKHWLPQAHKNKQLEFLK